MLTTFLNERLISGMTGPDHYREAERLLAQADRWESNVTDDLDSYAAIDGSRQAAQVHATLALAAASVAVRGIGPEQGNGWRELSADDDAWLVTR